MCFTDAAVYALLANVSKEHFGARRFAKFVYMTLTNTLKRDLLENLITCGVIKELSTRITYKYTKPFVHTDSHCGISRSISRQLLWLPLRHTSTPIARTTAVRFEGSVHVGDLFIFIASTPRSAKFGIDSLVIMRRTKATPPVGRSSVIQMDPDDIGEEQVVTPTRSYNSGHGKL